MFRDSEWRERAACLGMDSDLFFPETERGGSLLKESAQAFRVCARCPVKRECARDALEMNEVGIRAGILLTPTQTAATKRRKLLDVIVEAA